MTDKQCARNWNEFKKRSEDNERQKARMRLVKEIREALKEYSKYWMTPNQFPLAQAHRKSGEAIVLESILLSINKPSLRTLTAFQNVFNNVQASGWDEGYPTLGGRSAKLYDESKDLMVLAPQQEEDRLTSFLRLYFAILFTVSVLSPGSKTMNLNFLEHQEQCPL